MIGDGAARSLGSGRFPGRAPIEAYGNGGFRFADMSHRGAILCLPGAIVAWPPNTLAEIDAAHLAPILAEASAFSHLLIGTGARFALPPAGICRILTAAGIGFEPMDTGAACRTYNILLAEKRRVAAALLPVA